MTVLRDSKREGCSGFLPDGRVDLAGFLRWYFADEKAGEEGNDCASDWGRELKKWQAKRAKIEHDREAGELVEKATVSEQVREWNAKARAVLQRFLEVELPAQCAGLGAVEIARRNKAALAEVCEILSKAEPK